MNFIFQKGQFDLENNKFLPAPIFYKTFYLERKEKAYIYICSANIAVCYINGRKITKDLFISPSSVWDKTLYVNKYDVTRFLKMGKNLIKVIVGNGIRNEGIGSVWNLEKESHRNFPEFALQLFLGENLLVETDESWQYTLNSPIIYNQYRMGEYVDTRIKPKYSADLENAIVNKYPPKGKLTLSNFPQVRECEKLSPKEIRKIGEEQFLVDFGKNVSGYVSLNAVIPDGKEIKLQYAERIKEDGIPDYGGMPSHYYEGEFQTDKVIGNGKKVKWKPLFTYHGFRYVIVSGLENLKMDEIFSVFIHQDIKQAISFECSDKTLQQLFDMAINALWSNAVSLFTDCPTREKFGWLNDAMCSAEGLMYIFDCKDFALKLLRDFVDSVSDAGRAPCFLPPCEWGKRNCLGILMDSAIFEFADKIYEVYGDDSGFKMAYETCERVLNFLRTLQQPNGLYANGLCDWVGPYEDYLNPPAPLMLTDSVLMYKCIRIMEKGARILNKSQDELQYSAEAEILKKNIQKQYIAENGFATIAEMPVLSLLIAYDLYEDIEPLRAQFKAAVEKHNFHHYCGMITLRCLYDALDKCELSEYAYKILTSEGYPSYKDWINQGETSLCETWSNIGSSHNHHIHSAFTMWIIKTLCGFTLDRGKVKMTQPFGCVETFKLTYKKKGRKNLIIRNKGE